MSGPHRNPDKINTIGVVVVGICGAVLVYVSIVALQAFYMDDTAELQTMADYGGNDTSAKHVRSSQVGTIGELGSNPVDPKSTKPATFHIPIDRAIKLVADGAKVDPASLVPAIGRSDKATVQPVFGRPKLIAPPAPPPAPAGDGSGAGSASGSGAAGSGSGAGSAAGTTAAPQVPTGGSTAPATGNGN